MRHGHGDERTGVAGVGVGRADGVPVGPADPADILPQGRVRDLLNVRLLEGVPLREVEFQLLRPVRPTAFLVAVPGVAPVEPHRQTNVVEAQSGALRLHGSEAETARGRKLDSIEAAFGVQSRQGVTNRVAAIRMAGIHDIADPDRRRPRRPIPASKRSRLVHEIAGRQRRGRGHSTGRGPRPPVRADAGRPSGQGRWRPGTRIAVGRRSPSDSCGNNAAPPGKPQGGKAGKNGGRRYRGKEGSLVPGRSARQSLFARSPGARVEDGKHGLGNARTAGRSTKRFRRSPPWPTAPTPNWTGPPPPGNRLHAAGIPAWSVPAEYGGLALPGPARLRGYEQLAAACLTATFILSQRDAAVRRILSHGRPEIKTDLLPRLRAMKSS